MRISQAYTFPYIAQFQQHHMSSLEAKYYHGSNSSNFANSSNFNRAVPSNTTKHVKTGCDTLINSIPQKMIIKVLDKLILIFQLSIIFALGFAIHGCDSWRVPTHESLNAMSFNVQIFGVSKMGKPDVVAVLLDIFDRQDVSMMMEIRDASEESFPNFVQALNKYSQFNYNWTVGDRKGQSSSKEQYGFIWRTDKVKFLQMYEYPDTDLTFQRPPSVAQFQSIATGRTFLYIPIHTQPDNTIAEMNGLVDVYEASSAFYDTENAIIAGDFNAGCNYVCKTCWSDITLFTDQRFFWTVSSYANTTVAGSQCPYDRVVLAGKQMTKQVRNAHVFRYDLAWNLPHSLVKDVRDHYPIEFEIII